MHTYVHAYINTYTRTYIYTYIIHKNTYINTNTYIHNTYIHTYHTHIHTHTYIHTHTHTHIHTYIHTYTHTHTHTLINKFILAFSKQKAHVNSVLEIPYTYFFTIKLMSVHLCADFKSETVGDRYCFIITRVLCCLVILEGVSVWNTFGFGLIICALIHFT